MSDAERTCPNLATCPMFKVFGEEQVGKMLKTLYCESERHIKCARYDLMQKGGQVPIDLLPNGKKLV